MELGDEGDEVEGGVESVEDVGEGRREEQEWVEAREKVAESTG